MPGVLIDDMPFSLDYPVASSSPFLDNIASPSSFHQIHRHRHHHHHHHNHSGAAAAINTTINQQHQQSSGLLDTIMATVSSSPTSSATSSSAPSSPLESPRGTPHDAALTALHRFLPSNTSDDSAEDVYSCDEFRMFEFKVRRCMRGRSHDWTECPFAHPGEKARRRDPRRFHYSGTACPDFRKGSCKNGDACELAHGVFECWLHPARYRTQPCKDGRSCKRRVCFFAHTSEQLRLLPQVSQAMTTSSATSSPSVSPTSSIPTASSISCSSPPPLQPSSLFATLSSSSPCSSSPSPSSLLSDSFSASSSPRRSSAVTASLLRSFSDKTFASSQPVASMMDSFEPVAAGGSSYCQCCHQPQQQQQQQQQHARAVAACSAARLMSSPTSTLVGLAASPPPLSPPLSPSQSPPMSPSSGCIPSAVPRRHLESRRLGFASAPSSPGSHHPLHAKAMSDLVTALQQLELQKSVAAAQHGTNGIPHGAPGGTTGWVQCSPQYSTGPSPLRPGATSASWGTAVQPCGVPRGASVSLPCTPTKPRWETMWEMEMGEEDLLEEQEMLSMPVPRVESGRDLRAKIYGRLANKAMGNGGSAGESSGLGIGYEGGAGDPSPDLNWVNDLVTESGD